MAQVNKIFIPTYISSIDYKPARVLPHVYFYNGTKASDTFFIQGYVSGSKSSVKYEAIDRFPYFDNYNGNTPTTGSKSLLFNNEPTPYGSIPNESLYSEYWSKYVSLLYNPRTRLIDASAIIPLADYFKMELNDIVEWRGNYYHLRAINDYNLTNGECSLQLLGPILSDTIGAIFGGSCLFDFTSVAAATTTTTTTIAPTTTTTTTLAPTTTTTSTTTTTTLAPTTTTTTTLAPLTISFMITAGGGGGGQPNGGGGGAGGWTISSYTAAPNTTYPVVIGGGGAVNANGGNSSIFTTTYIGGGRGGYGVLGSSPLGTDKGADGGNGGGGGAASTTRASGGSASNNYDGGSGVYVNGQYITGGGGGGAAAKGANGASNKGGNGGDGRNVWYDGVYRAGGGGGGYSGVQSDGAQGIGGNGGGGNGSRANTQTSTAGTVNTGGGGGGGINTSGTLTASAGGSGIVILRYVGTPRATGGTITQSGGYTYHEFTTSDNFITT